MYIKCRGLYGNLATLCMLHVGLTFFFSVFRVFVRYGLWVNIPVAMFFGMVDRITLSLFGICKPGNLSNY